MLYVTVEEAREAGVPGDDAEVTRKVRAAQHLVDSFCGQSFTAGPWQTVVTLDEDGVASLPRRLVEVTAVRNFPERTLVPEGDYWFTSSDTDGLTDQIGFAVAQGFDLLRKGYEFYAPVRTHDGRRLVVEGRFGWETVPDPVKDALLTLVAPSGLNLNLIGVKAFAVEGLSETLADADALTTGKAEVDRMLLPFRRQTAGLQVH